EPRTPWDWV
uniref:Tryptophyllin-4 n=1 Tax=Ascaphus truei TaxID=8439 RepID=TY4_ASCTR|nr:RecName: Full=Tryptophyllin-4 [Ascaphus truei]